jgi:hypothetical protein
VIPATFLGGCSGFGNARAFQNGLGAVACEAKCLTPSAERGRVKMTSTKVSCPLTVQRAFLSVLISFRQLEPAALPAVRPVV